MQDFTCRWEFQQCGITLLLKKIYEYFFLYCVYFSTIVVPLSGDTLVSKRTLSLWLTRKCFCRVHKNKECKWFAFSVTVVRQNPLSSWVKGILYMLSVTLRDLYVVSMDMDDSHGRDIGRVGSWSWYHTSTLSDYSLLTSHFSLIS